VPPFYSLHLDVKGVKKKVPEALSCAYLLALFKPKLNGQVWSKFSTYHCWLCLSQGSYQSSESPFFVHRGVWLFCSNTDSNNVVKASEQSRHLPWGIQGGYFYEQVLLRTTRGARNLISRVLSVITITRYRRKIWLPNLLYGSVSVVINQYSLS